MLTPEAGLELAQLSTLVLGQADLDSALVDVTRVAVRVVPAADGASLTMRDGGAPQARQASDDWATELDKLQFVEQEGPCLDCLREGTVMRSPDLDGDQRFPNYGPRAAALGAHSVMSLPLAADGRTVGALNLYSRKANAFDAGHVGLGELLAAHASLAIQAAQAFYSNRELAEQLRQAMHSRAVIEQAKGILASRQGIDPERAFELLKTQSQHMNIKLREVAEDLVRRTSQQH